MNKTININLGGFFFHIDEDAYKKLRRYLDSISKSLSDDAQGKNEIIADIEARISELLSEKITDARQVVNEGDIEEIIAIMGQPEDYSDTESAYTNARYSYSRNNTSGKRLFRDGDDKFLGGVAAGIAHYFGVDTIWIRLGLLALFFGAGFGVLVYIILWILLPEAKTTAEKLQMEGEDVNIDNIEKKIRDEFTAMSDKVRNVADDVSDKIKNGAHEISDKLSKTDFRAKGSKANSGLEDFLDALGKMVLVFFKVIGKFIGVLLIFVAAAVILSLIIGGFSVGSLEFLNVDGEFLQYPPFFYNSIMPKWLLTLFVFLLIGIPFLILFILGLRILSSNVKQLSKPTSLTLLGIWIIALLAMVFTGIEYGTSHANYGQHIEKSPLNFVANDTIAIKMINDDNLYYQHNLRRSSHKHEVAINRERKIYATEIFVNVKKSTSDEVYMTIQKESRGKSRYYANRNAENINYNYTVTNNEIVLDAFYISAYQNKWKEEDVKVTLYIPENITVYFDSSTKGFLSNVNNTTDTYDRDMARHYFLMTKEGLHSKELEELEEIEKED
jgi:phage shock protein PspC (stress-responsive transcriptional regulator)